MPNFRMPGIDVNEIVSSPHVIHPMAATATAFVAATANGPRNEPVRLQRFDDYVAHFGPLGDYDDRLGLALHLFFANGGDDALVIGLDPDNVSTNDYLDAFSAFVAKDPSVGMLVLPDQCWSEDQDRNETLRHLVSASERTNQSMVLIDLATDIRLSNAGSVRRLKLPESACAALYYPRVALVHPTTNKTIDVEISAMAAAVFARTDRERGVWQAPAGKEARLFSVENMAVSLTDHQRSVLAPLGINTLFELPRGPSVWGARTLSKDPQGRYVPVHRLGLMIDYSLTHGLAWVSNETNNVALWEMVSARARDFMHILFRAGAFTGTSEDDAYFVRCGLGTTMSAADIAAKRLIVEIGYAPLRPAEFSIKTLRIPTAS
ncbi:MAG: phage tail sheath family protein [Gammaproteobacteria bacterium]